MRIIGAGTILFGVWTVAKTASLILFNPEQNLDLATVMVFAASLLIRIDVGNAAIAVGRGRRRRGGFILLACLLLIGSVLTIAILLYAFTVFDTQERDSVFVPFIIEATSAILITEMIINSVRIRKILKNREKNAD